MKILSVNISKLKGTPKEPVPSISLYENGIREDAHAGSWHRQISLLGVESYPKWSFDPHSQVINETLYYNEDSPKYGIYAENITIEGAPDVNTPSLKHCSIGDIFRCGATVLEVTQIGKKCHGESCSVKQKVGSCVMPIDGIFTRVINGGELKAGDILTYHPKIWKTAIITISTRGYQGIYEDKSGPALKYLIDDFCKSNNWKNIDKYSLIPDDKTRITDEIKSLIENDYDFIFTTGGTGVGPNDFTSSIINNLIDKEIPGIMDFIRNKYGNENPNALLSSSIAAIAKNSMIFSLPGSVKAVNEYFYEISRCLKHLVYMHKGIDSH